MAQSMTVSGTEAALSYSESLQSTNDWTNEDFTCQESVILDHTAVEKPSTTILTMHIIYPNGATILWFTSGSGVTTAAYREDSKIALPPGTILRTNSTGGISGDKIVTVIVKRVDA